MNVHQCWSFCPAYFYFYNIKFLPTRMVYTLNSEKRLQTSVKWARPKLRLEQYILCDVVMVSNARVTKRYLKVSIDKVCKKGIFLCSIFSLASQMFKIYSPSTKLSTNIWEETCGSFSLSVTCKLRQHTYIETWIPGSMKVK